MSEPNVPDRANRRAATRRRRLLLLGGAAVVAIVAVVVVVLLATGGSDDGPTLGAAVDDEPWRDRPVGDDGARGHGARPLKSGVCSAQQLTGERASTGIKGQSQVAVVALTNRSETPCTLNGVPGSRSSTMPDVPTVVTVGGGALRRPRRPGGDPRARCPGVVRRIGGCRSRAGVG